MLRIQHVITSLEDGGAQRILARLVAATCGQVVNEVLTVVRPTDRAMREYSELGVSVHHVGASHPALSALTITKIASRIRRFEPHILQGWMYHANLFTTLASKWSGSQASVLWNVRHVAESQARDGCMTRALIRAARFFAGSVDKILFNSHRSRMQHERLGYPSAKSLVIHNGFDLQKFVMDRSLGEAWRLKHGFSKEEFLIGHAARYHPVKNHAGLLRAFSAVAHSGCRLVLVGDRVGPQNSELRRLAADLGCAARVVFRGPEPDMNAFYNAIDLLVLPSLSEAFPNVIGEAMCCGRPCLATDVGDVAELMGECGWLVKSGDGGALRECLAFVLRMDRTRLSSFGATGRERIANHFNIQSMAKRYLDVYMSLGTR